MNSDNRNLQVTSIIWIVLGGIIFFMDAIALLTIVSPDLLNLDVDLSGTDMIALFFTMIISGLEIAAGILGVKYNSRPKKMNLCLTIGLVIFVLSVIDILAGLIRGTYYPDNLFTPILGNLLLGLLYLAEAKKIQSAPAALK